MAIKQKKFLDKIRSYLRERHFNKRVYKQLIKDKKSYLHTSGWIKSLKENFPMTQQGDPLPWMNYPVIQLLQNHLDKTHHIFEFGSGGSTLFFSHHAASVTSVEPDPKWYDKLKQQRQPNMTLIYREKDRDGKYCRAIHTDNRKYDLIVIDGYDREHCMMHAIECLTQRGVLLLDDSHRYKELMEQLLAKGFSFQHFQGLKPLTTGIEYTTLFFKKGNFLDLHGDNNKKLTLKHSFEH